MKYVKSFSVMTKMKNEDKVIEAFDKLEVTMIGREYRKLISMPVVELWYMCDSDNITPEDIAEYSEHIRCKCKLQNFKVEET